MYFYKGMFGLEKIEKLLGFEIYVGHMHCDGKMIVPVGQKK